MQIKSFLPKSRWLVTIVLLLFLSIGNAWGDNAIIYSETFGTTGNNTAWSSYSGWSNNTTSSKTSTTSWKVSKTNSDVCGISGSSGSCNAYCGGTSGATLVFTFGDISAYSNIVLSFNYFNNRAGGNARTFTCEVSSDGGSSWSSNILASNTTNGWCSTTVTYNVSSAQAANFAVNSQILAQILPVLMMLNSLVVRIQLLQVMGRFY